MTFLEAASIVGDVAMDPKTSDHEEEAIRTVLTRCAKLERLYYIVSKADHFDTGLQVGEDFDKIIEELEK